MQKIRDGAEKLGLQVISLEVGNPADFAVAFDVIAKETPDALIVDTDVLTVARRASIAGVRGEAATSNRIRRARIRRRVRSRRIRRQHL